MSGHRRSAGAEGGDHHADESTDAAEAGRERMVRSLIENWERADFDELVRLLRMLTDGVTEHPAAAG